MTQQAVWPSEILDHRASQVIELVWADGIRARLPYARLRAACRCAECVSLRRNTGCDPVSAQDILLTAMTPVGETGLQLHFSDAHERGIFPWAYLRELSLHAA
jgi:DUF971 family protein